MGFGIAVLVALGLLVFLVGASVDGLTKPAWLARGLGFLRAHSPLLLGLVWIAYGLAHLGAPASGELEIPSWFRRWRAPLWAASGAFEIALGLTVVDRKWRRISLLA